MKELMKHQESFKSSCCEETFEIFFGDVMEICFQSKQFYDYWQKARKFRITGSICYQIYTYTKNKKPNWSKKCCDIFSPKNFKSEYTEYGKSTEKFARDEFVAKTKKMVIETGLIVSQQNP